MPPGNGAPPPDEQPFPQEEVEGGGLSPGIELQGFQIATVRLPTGETMKVLKITVAMEFAFDKATAEAIGLRFQKMTGIHLPGGPGGMQL